MHVLLHDEQGRAEVLELRQPLVDLVDNDRRQPERQLVHDQQARRVGEHTGEREHALLAAGQGPAELLATPLSWGNSWNARSSVSPRSPFDDWRNA